MTGMLILFSPALFLFIVEVVPAMKIPGPKGESTKGKSTEAKSGRPETPKLGKGRREQRRELAQIDRRVWHLWALSITVTLVLALAILVFFYPALKWRGFPPPPPGPARPPPPLSALCVPGGALIRFQPLHGRGIVG